MHRSLFGAALLATALAVPAFAEDGQWTEVTRLPMGLNLPAGVNLSILGIAPGMHIDEVRPIAEALLKEQPPETKAEPQTPEEIARALEQEMLDRASGVDTSPPLEEIPSGVILTMPGGDQIRLEYTGQIDLDRQTHANAWISDELRVDFSAPSSGHQVIGIQRRLDYNANADQPRIAPILDDLKARFGAPMVLGDGAVKTYRWQYDDGRLVSREPGQDDCWPYVGGIRSEGEVADINTRSGGDCDVVLDVRIASGISDDHASSIYFELSDNERGKANHRTDFDFFHSYVDRYRDSVGGEQPKL